MFALALTLALWSWLDTRDARLYLPLVALFGTALVGTQSLGGVAQALSTFLAFALLTRRFRTRSMVAIASGLVFVVIFLLSPIGSQRLEELETTTPYSVASRGQAYTTNSLDWRFYNWAQEIRAWRDEPILGYGLGSTAAIISPGGSIPHSDFLRLLVETGVIGFVLFGGALIVLCHALYRRTRLPSYDGAYATLALSIVLGLLVHGLVNNASTQTATMYSTAIVVGIALGGPALVRRRL
jgi:O-antigen ligase